MSNNKVHNGKLFYMIKLILNTFLTGILFPGMACAQHGNWNLVESNNNIGNRSECSLVGLDGKLYLIGGDGWDNAVAEYDPLCNIWTKKAEAPKIMHHFQGVGYGHNIYVLNAFTTKDYPDQKTLENVYSYNVRENFWRKLSEIPVDRRRAGAGTVVYNNKFYSVGGMTHGHRSGTNAMFDCYDPLTDKWTILPDAPHIRDHSTAVIVGDKLYAIGGRNTSLHDENNFESFLDKVVLEVDCYNFKTGKWSTLLQNLPLGTGGGTAVNLDDKIYYIGGERATAVTTNTPQTDVFYLDPAISNKWIKAGSLNKARNGVGGTVLNHKIYIAGGSAMGQTPLQAASGLDNIELEVFSLD